MLSKLKENKLYLILSLLFFLLFILLVILLLTVDKKEVDGSMLGLATINLGILNTFKGNKVCDKISDLILVLSFLNVLAFFILGIIKLIKNKSLDLELVILGAFYIILGIIYLVFDHIHFNYAPLLYNDEVKESFPSSHVLASLFIFLSSIFIYLSKLNKGVFRNLLIIESSLFILLMLVFRMLSGAHYFTDILGSIFLVCALNFLYVLIINMLDKKEIVFGKKNEA